MLCCARAVSLFIYVRARILYIGVCDALALYEQNMALLPFLLPLLCLQKYGIARVWAKNFALFLHFGKS